MTDADRARGGRAIRVMMAAMSGWLGGVARSETRCRRAAFGCGALALLAGCSIDDRNVQSTAGDPGGSETSGLTEPGGSSPADSSPADGNSPGSSTDGTGAPGSGAPAFAASGANDSGPSGAAGSAGASDTCAAGAQRCQDGTLYVCNDGGMLASLGMSCGECVPDTSECAGSTLRVCSSAGVWIDRLQCAGSQPVCRAARGSCVCDERSCPLGQLCSSETFSCVEQVSDCPLPSPIAPSDDHDLGIVSVRFDPATGSADVRLQNIGTGIVFFDTVLCNGPDNCVPVLEQNTLQLGARDTVDVTIPNTRVEGGELAFLDDVPALAAQALAYVAWGTGPSSNAFEALANEFILNWRPGERIQVAPGDSGFVCTGNANEAAGFTSCNPGPFAP